VRSRLHLVAGKLTPLVGRQSELGMLLDAWERVLGGIGQTMLVHGEPGVGKSRLECSPSVRAARTARRCATYLVGVPLQPVHAADGHFSR